VIPIQRRFSKKRVTTTKRFNKMGVSLHFCQEVQGFLDHEFPGKWTGRDGPTTWPFWGYIKDVMYLPPLAATLPLLAEQIRAAVTSVTHNLLSKMWTEL